MRCSQTLTKTRTAASLISTVRADFLTDLSSCRSLQSIYKALRALSPVTISEDGLREVIAGRARLADLDASEVTTQSLKMHADEVGALPLVENALHNLWKKAKGRLSGAEVPRAERHRGHAEYAERTICSERIEAPSQRAPGALELLFRLTRINDEGRHTRQRITR